MPNTENIVINTGPIIALVAAFGELKMLSSLYRKVLVPFEVIAEIRAGGPKRVRSWRIRRCHLACQMDKSS